jgi:hypothetical protein
MILKRFGTPKELQRLGKKLLSEDVPAHMNASWG